MSDDLTTRLSHELHDQADDVRSAPLSLDSVRGRARTIRRTRRLAAAGVAAVAVAAIAVPSALVGDLVGRTDSDLPPATNTPGSPTEGTDTSVPELQVGTLGIPYLADTVLTLPDGSQATLPESYQGGSVLGDTVLGVRSDASGNLVLDELDGEQQVVGTTPVDSGIAPNLEGDAIAYVSEGELVVRWEDGQTELGEVGPVQVVRLVGGPDCTLGADDCVVYVNDGETPRFLNSSGEGAEVPGEPLSVKDADDDRRVATLTRVTEEPGSCGRVFDLQAQSEVFATCDYTLGRFSEDGALISATQSYESGFGDAFHAILDAASGEELARYEPAQGGAVYYSVWEDPEHLLVLSYEDGAWLVTRLGADGSAETALEPVDGSEEEPPYVLLGATF